MVFENLLTHTCNPQIAFKLLPRSSPLQLFCLIICANLFLLWSFWYQCQKTERKSPFYHDDERRKVSLGFLETFAYLFFFKKGASEGNCQTFYCVSSYWLSFLSFIQSNNQARLWKFIRDIKILLTKGLYSNSFLLLLFILA